MGPRPTSRWIAARHNLPPVSYTHLDVYKRQVQYPGVRQSIDSDVDNVATLLRVAGLLPGGLDVGPLLRESKRQLHAEANYLGEGAWLSRYAGLLADSPEFILPAVDADLTTESVLAMSCMGGEPVESLLHAPQAERDRVAGLLFRLLFREIFEFRLIQTDPNFANYRYDKASRQLILLDFGATRPYPAAVVDAYRQLMASAEMCIRDSGNYAPGVDP